jgi:trigger factor
MPDEGHRPPHKEPPIVKSELETLNPTRVKLTVEVPFEELKPSLDAAYKKIAGSVTIPGFRKGRVPPRIIDQRFGRAAVLEEAVNDALPRFYGQAVEENSVKVLGQPEVDVTEFNDGDKLLFTAEVDVRPDFELPDYKGLAVTVEDAQVTDTEIDEQLDGLRERFATLTGVERAAVDGDFVSIDLSAIVGPARCSTVSTTRPPGSRPASRPSSRRRWSAATGPARRRPSR